jgi:hypothetical protein
VRTLVTRNTSSRSTPEFRMPRPTSPSLAYIYIWAVSMCPQPKARARSTTLMHTSPESLQVPRPSEGTFSPLIVWYSKITSLLRETRSP